MQLSTISTWIPLIELLLAIQMVFYIHDSTKKHNLIWFVKNKGQQYVNNFLHSFYNPKIKCLDICDKCENRKFNNNFKYF
jgi:hypothetical protein